MYGLLIEDANCTVATQCTSDDLILVSLKHDDRRVSEKGTTDSGVWVFGYFLELTKHDVVCDDIRQSVGILGEASWGIGDYTRTLELGLRAR